jgi:methyl-accepting chemotaxis protein
VTTVDRGLAETTTVLASLADADLTRRMEGEYEGAFARLKDDLNRVADRLSRIVSQLQHASTDMRSAADDILNGSNDLSQRTAVQSATIEKTSQTIEALAGTVLQNAERAQQASALAATVMRTAESGGGAMIAATESMDRIVASSAKVANIVNLIDDIAFQTNLLALNASVEAARAGDAGRGFAVVAVEVRRLAQSAARASLDIKDLIARGAEDVATGSRQVADAAQRLEDMLTGARSSHALIEDIADESREQAAAIGDVSSAMRTLDEISRRDARLVETTREAIVTAEARVNELDHLVALFTVDRDDDVAASSKPEARSVA